MWKWVKIPKGIALAAFFLPWMTVSCSGQKMLSASGFNLVTGNLSMSNPMTGATQSAGGHFNIVLAIALVAVVVGLVFSFMQGRVAMQAAIGSAITAIVLILVSSSQINGKAVAEAVSKQGTDALKGLGGAGGGGGLGGLGSGGPDLASLIRIEWEMGYWVTLLSLIAAAVMAFMALTGRSVASLGGAGSGAPPV